MRQPSVSRYNFFCFQLQIAVNAFVIVAEFRSYFERFGKVLFAEVMYARETHKPRGFGFVVFQSEQVMEKVCSEGPHVIDGKTVNRTVSTLNNNS